MVAMVLCLLFIYPIGSEDSDAAHQRYIFYSAISSHIFSTIHFFVPYSYRDVLYRVSRSTS